MNVQENVFLAPYTTFKIGGPAKYFCVVKTELEAKEAYEFAKRNNLPVFVLGGGSNVLIGDNGYNGLVIKVENEGVDVLSENDAEVHLKVSSGEVWDKIVGLAVKNSWWGIENLSHIPGNTGAIAVQNVGAYGQEASQIIESVLVFNAKTKLVENLKTIDCNFSYRQSIFNGAKKGHYIIFKTTLRLKKNAKPNLGYRDLKAKFAGDQPLLSEIRQAVIEIRNKKFPFPTEAKNGNAGSFFKNPILADADYQNLKKLLAQNLSLDVVKSLEQKKFQESGRIKVPAAFLIEICGLKDLKSGGAAINKNQPLVIINQTGTATAEDVLSLANQVKQEVLSKTGIAFKFEPELIGFN